MQKTIKAALAAVRAFVVRNPARVISATAAVIVFAAARVGIVVPRESVVHALELIVPVILSGEATRLLVSPVALLKDAEHALTGATPAAPAKAPQAPASK